MGMRSQPPDATARVPAQPDAAPPGAADPGAAPVDVDSELAAQLDELDRCLARMDAVVSMLEADLERRVAAWSALAPEILSTLASMAEQSRQPKKGRHRTVAVRSGQARRGR